MFVSSEVLLWIAAFAIQIVGTVLAIGMWSSKLTVRVEALEKASEEHTGLALAVRQLETIMKRAVSDIEGLMDRFSPQSITGRDPFSIAGIPSDVLARAFVEMAKRP